MCQPGSQDTTPDASIQHMVRFLLDKYPTAHVVILGVLPKGSQWPNSCTPAQQRLNGALQQVRLWARPGQMGDDSPAAREAVHPTGSNG